MDKVIEIFRVYDRIIKFRVVLENITVTFISAYAPQLGLADEERD